MEQGVLFTPASFYPWMASVTRPLSKGSMYACLVLQHVKTLLHWHGGVWLCGLNASKMFGSRVDLVDSSP